MLTRLSPELKEIIFLVLAFKPINLILMFIGRLLASLGLMGKVTSECLPARAMVKVKLSGGRFFVMENREGRDLVANSLFWLGADGYESESIRVWSRLAEEAKYIFDIGAYTGIYSLTAAVSNPEAALYAFEPILKQYRCFQRNIEINHFKNVYAFPKAVSDSQGIILLYVPRQSLFATTPSIENIFDDGKNMTTTEVDCVTLDQFIDDQRIPKIDLVKVDVELAEAKVMKGMKKTIHQSRPFILMEVLPIQTTEAFFEEFCSQTEYTPFWITSRGVENVGKIRGDTSNRFRNYLFVPREKVELLNKLLNK